MSHPNVVPRRAYICLAKDCQAAPRRVFVLPGEKEPPNCPDGHGRMQLQANLPYERPDTSLPIGRSKAVEARKRS